LPQVSAVVPASRQRGRCPRCQPPTGHRLLRAVPAAAATRRRSSPSRPACSSRRVTCSVTMCPSAISAPITCSPTTIGA
jgi:hypothetical protein